MSSQCYLQWFSNSSRSSKRMCTVYSNLAHSSPFFFVHHWVKACVWQMMRILKKAVINILLLCTPTTYMLDVVCVTRVSIKSDTLVWKNQIAMITGNEICALTFSKIEEMHLMLNNDLDLQIWLSPRLYQLLHKTR